MTPVSVIGLTFGDSPSGQWGFSRGVLVSHSLIWKISAGICAAGWLASVAVTGLMLGVGQAWSLLMMNVATSATSVLFLWTRTTHPNDAWSDGNVKGIEEGRRLEREAMDRHPRSGELRVCR